MNTELRDYMHFFGYASHPDPAMESPTQFAKYTDQTEEELQKYNEFLKLNEKLLKEERTLPVQTWNVNGGPPNMSIFTGLRVLLG